MSELEREGRADTGMDREGGGGREETTERGENVGEERREGWKETGRHVVKGREYAATVHNLRAIFNASSLHAITIYASASPTGILRLASPRGSCRCLIQHSDQLAKSITREFFHVSGITV